MNRIALQMLSLVIGMCSASVCWSQTENPFEFNRIEDNSFLLEEAYNQEPGVIQHISAFQYMNNKTWSYTFVEEWPVPGQKHQLSTSIPILNTGNTGLGDVALNYRYQAILTSRLGFSPRISLLLPSGDFKKGLGYGVFGYQVNLPLSFIFSHKLVMHFNVGTTITPGAKESNNMKADIENINYGTSAIVLISETFNFMFEIAGNTIITESGNNKPVRSSVLIVNPGIRYAINFKSGLQIVPGIAVPIGIGPSGGDIGVFAYLSFEHPMWKPK